MIIVGRRTVHLQVKESRGNLYAVTFRRVRVTKASQGSLAAAAAAADAWGGEWRGGAAQPASARDEGRVGAEKGDRGRIRY